MNKGTRRAAAIVALFFIMDILTGMTESIDAERRQAEAVVAELNRKAEEQRQERATYEEALQTIVTKLYEKEAYSEIGGSVPSTAVEIDVVYQAIVNASEDYDGFMKNVENFFDMRTEIIAKVPSIFPVLQSAATRITSGYGWRLSPITNTMSFHPGLDIAGGRDTKIIATADGEVRETWLPPGVYWGKEYYGEEDLGGVIVIDHGGGYATRYGHLSTNYVVKGDKVERGQVIGLMGNTGKSLGRHLHYEIERDGELVDPLEYLSSNRILVMGK